MACPVCRCQKFYIRDPEDSFETREFELKNGSIHYGDTDNDPTDLELTQECEIYCQRCAWHGPLNQIAGC